MLDPRDVTLQLQRFSFTCTNTTVQFCANCHAVPIVQYDKSFFFFVLESSSAAVAATRQAGALGSGDCTTEYCQ